MGSGLSTPTDAAHPPEKFTWEMGVRKWGWGNNPMCNDSIQDRMLMATTSAAEHADIDAFRRWRSYVASERHPDKGG